MGTRRSMGFTAKFESTFVAANIKPADVAPVMTAPQVMSDVFDDYVAYLRSSSRLIERTYELEKLGGFDGAGTTDSKQFTVGRLAAAASELRDLYYSAWLESAKPVPEWSGAPKTPAAAAKPSAGL